MQDTRRAILRAIDQEAQSGPAIAEDLDISRAAVWKHVEALRDAGFAIESTDGGYTLTDRPEFGALAVEYGLAAPYTVEYHDTVEATNAIARERAVAGKIDHVVLADEQTGGQGRLDREWVSPSGGIWASVICAPTLPPAAVPRVTLGAAVAIHDAIADRGYNPEIKWPNDVLVGDASAKVAGILTEMEGEADAVDWVVIGLGINANIDQSGLPEGATSLEAQCGPVSRAALTQDLLDRFHELVTDPDTILPAWRKRSSTLGREVRVETPMETIEGTAVDVVDPGALLVETATGTERVHAGDCTHLRPAEKADSGNGSSE